MQPILRQKLIRRSETLVLELFPESASLEPTDFPSTWRLWRLNSSSSSAIFLSLAVADKDDSFALELGWNEGSSLPEFSGQIPKDEQGINKAYFRLSRLWKPFGMEERWYLGGARGPQEIMTRTPDDPLEIKMRNLEFQLQDAFSKLKEFGVPYLELIAAQLGTELRTMRG